MSDAKQGVTEFVFMHVAENSQPGEGHENFFGTTPGFQSGRYGWQVEDPTVFQWVINWESLDAHKAFMASAEYPAFIQKVTPWAPKLSLFHAEMTPHPPPSAAGLTTELVKLFLKDGVTREQLMQAFLTALDCAKDAKGYHSYSVGWSVEDKDCLVGFLVWDSKKAHVDWTQTEEGLKVLRGPGGLADQIDKVEMYHIDDGEAIIPLK